MSVEQSIREKLSQALDPVVLSVVNESHMHNVPKNSETHFKVVIVSERFSGLSRIARQRLVHDLLKEELEGPVHALSQKVYTPEEWQDRGESGGASSPPCLGGSRK